MRKHGDVIDTPVRYGDKALYSREPGDDLAHMRNHDSLFLYMLKFSVHSEGCLGPLVLVLCAFAHINMVMDRSATDGSGRILSNTIRPA